MSQMLDPVTHHHVRQAAEALSDEFSGVFSQETIERYIGESLDLLGPSKINVFVPVRTLSRMATGDADPKATVLLAGGTPTEQLNARLREALRVEDYGLRLREIDGRHERPVVLE